MVGEQGCIIGMTNTGGGDYEEKTKVSTINSKQAIKVFLIGLDTMFHWCCYHFYNKSGNTNGVSSWCGDCLFYSSSYRLLCVSKNEEGVR